MKSNTDQKDAKHSHIQWPKALYCKTALSATRFLQNFSHHTLVFYARSLAEPQYSSGRFLK